MKLRSCMALPVSCYGNSLATCEMVLSGAKRCARKSFALLILLSLVFSFPVFAGKLDSYPGVISLEPQSLGYRDNSLTTNTDWGFGSVPASFEFSDDVYTFNWAAMTAITGNVYSLVTNAGKDFEVILNFGDGSDPNLDVYFDSFAFAPSFLLSYTGQNGNFYRRFGFSGYYEVFVDGELIFTSKQYEAKDFPSVNPRRDQINKDKDFHFSVSRYISFVWHNTEEYVNVFDLSDLDLVKQTLKLTLSGLTVNNELSQLDRIEVNVGNIESDLEDIKVSVENIEEGVVNIEGSVTDMKEQLEDSSSPIWNAAGEKIADTVTGLFVPPQEELVAKKQELEQKLDDKLGSAGDLVDVGEEFVSGVMGGFGRDDIANNYSLQFPGIAFPMNGEQYVIIPAQEVKLNNRAFVIFQDALGFAVTAICFFSIIHICEDAIYCLISGVSYWGFIRSRHDK